MERPVAALVIDFGIEGITITSSLGQRPGFLLQLTHTDTRGTVSASDFQLSPQQLQALCSIGLQELAQLRAFLEAPPNPSDTSGQSPERDR